MSLQLHDALPPDVDGDGDLDLTRFDALGHEARMRVIIRVLCGLVALEDEDWFRTSEPTRDRPRFLPYLGLERHAPADFARAREAEIDHGLLTDKRAS